MHTVKTTKPKIIHYFITTGWCSIPLSQREGERRPQHSTLKCTSNLCSTSHDSMLASTKIFWVLGDCSREKCFAMVLLLAGFSEAPASCTTSNNSEESQAAFTPNATTPASVSFLETCHVFVFCCFALGFCLLYSLQQLKKN